MEWKFRKSDGTYLLDVKQYVEDWINHHPNCELHVGCDSKRRGNNVKYAVSICLRDLGNGVHELHANTIIKDISDNFTRLWEEVHMSVELAKELNTIGKPITVHVDFNSEPQFLSNRLYEASMGFIKSYGYKAISKPNAWAASSGAHGHCQ